MNPAVRKLKLLYLPFLLFTLLLTGGYTLLNWLLMIKLHLFSFSDMVTNFAIPAILPALPIFFFFYPRLKLLRLERDNGKSWRELYIVLLWIAFLAPNIIAQEYMEKASGKLTQLDNAKEIPKHEQSKYYTLKHYYIDKAHPGVHPTFEVHGKHNEDFAMTIYIAMPILQSASDTVLDKCEAWLGTSYSKTISNRLSDEEKEKRYQEFAQNSQEDFDRADFGGFTYLNDIARDNDAEHYREAINENEHFKGSKQLVLEAKTEPFAQRTGDAFEWIFISMGIAALVWLIMVMSPKLNAYKLRQFDNGKSFSIMKDTKEFLALFVPKNDYFITAVILDLNVLIFLVMMFSGLGFMSFSGKDLLAWGADYGPLTKNGEWWRLITSTFLHGGFIHLLGNMFGLIFVGVVLEPVLGRVKFALVYLLTGLAASCCSLWCHETTVSVGASGAIFGLYGTFLALLITKVFSPAMSKAFLMGTLVFVGYNLAMGFAVAGGIDNAAHIGGLLSGFVIGLIVRLTLKPVPNEEEDPLSGIEEKTLTE